LAIGRVPDHACQARQIAEADGQIEGNHGFFSRAKRQPEREIAGGGAVAIEQQRRAQGGEPQAKRIRIADASPDSDRRTAKRSVRARPHEPDLSGLSLSFRERRRLHERAQRSQRFE